MTMSDEGRKIWNSPAGVHLLLIQEIRIREMSPAAKQPVIRQIRIGHRLYIFCRFK